MQNQIPKTRIITLSRVLRHAILIAAIAHTVVVLVALVLMHDSQLAQTAIGTTGHDLSLSTGQRAAMVALGVFPALIISIGLLFLRPALRDMGAGRPFGKRAFHGLRRLAAAIMIGTIAKWIAGPMAGIVASWHSPEQSFSLFFSLGDFQMLILGMGIWLMAWVMAAGYDLAAENAQYV